MLASKATTGLFKTALWKADNIVSLGIIKNPQNTSQIQQFYIVHKRYKKTSSDDKKWEDKHKKSTSKLVTFAKVAVAGTTVAVIAAKYDDDFRDWTKEHVPALDSLVKIVFQEEDTYLQTLDKAHKELSAWIKSILYDLFKSSPKQDTGALGPRTGGIPPAEPCDESKKPYKTPESAFVLKGEDEKKEESLKPGQVPKELKDLKGLEDKWGKTAQETIRILATIMCAVKDRANLLDHLDTLISSGSQKVWDRLKKAQEDVAKGAEKVKENLIELKALEKQLSSKLTDNKNISDPVKATAQNNINTVTMDVDKAREKLEKTQEHSQLAKRSWERVKQARLHFSEELETLFPNIWLNDKKLNIPVDELDPFTEKILKSISDLERQLAKTQTLTDALVNSTLEKYKNKDPNAIEEIADVLVPHQINKEKVKSEAELQKNMLAHKAKCDKNQKSMMKQTKEVYADLTAEALRLKEKEVERKVQQQLEEELAKARAQHKLEIAKMVGRMQGANEAISKRGEKDVHQQVNQQFWSAAQNFKAAVKPIGGAAQEPKPLKNEIANLNKAKPEGDELVESVINSIPPAALEKGVPTEACLREKFIKVMHSARGWAGVPPGEITLIQLLLARVQSALYLNVPIPKAELDNEPAIDPEKLNNYDILNRAKYYVDKGEFDQAIRYLNLLKGPSSMVAGLWIKDALVYLETRQAAEVLMAHATVSGM